jgi:hypothetical protein
MLTEEDKQVLERIIVENPEKGKLQQELQKLTDQMLNDIMEREGRTSEGSA